MKMRKGNVVKEVENSIVADYVTAGWKKEDDKVSKKNKENKDLENKYEL